MNYADATFGDRSVFISIVTYNSADFIERCLESVLALADFSIGQNLLIQVTDNASSDKTADLVAPFADRGVRIVTLERNLGYCGGHNLAARSFQDSGADYFMVLNPDVRLQQHALSELVKAILNGDRVGAVCPLLYRADSELNPVEPRLLDAAGMHLTKSLRHFDRGSNCRESSDYLQIARVFGGSGAALLLSAECVSDVVIAGGQHEDAVMEIYPELQMHRELRLQLFDEAFFAYREDADLAWRMQRLGWQCLYVPRAIGYHKRKVLPAGRGAQEKRLNLLGVKNRFLLQFNNYSFAGYPAAFLPGIISRNLLVVIAVLCIERSSIQGIIQAWKLRHRARERYLIVRSRQRCSERDLQIWFKVQAQEYGDD